MSRKQDQTTDNAPFGKYFHVMLNMADDDLNPYQYRLLGHYRRVCGDNGACWESTRTTAKKCKMSTGKVSKTRKELAAAGYAHIEYRDDDTCRITLVDRMAENIQRYCSQSEQPVHHMNASVHQVKQRITNEEEPLKKNQKKKDLPDKPADEKQPRKRRPQDDHFDELVRLKGIDYAKMTDTEKSFYAKVSGELYRAGYSLSDLNIIYQYCLEFDNFSIAAMSKHASDAIAEHEREFGKRTSSETPAESAPQPTPVLETVPAASGDTVDALAEYETLVRQLALAKDGSHALKHPERR